MAHTYAEDIFCGQPGFLYPCDICHNELDRAFCNPLSDGWVQFRVHADPVLCEAVLVYNAGTVQGAWMEPVLAAGEDAAGP